MKFKCFLMVLGLMLVLFSYSFAQVPQMINYQGKLTKTSGAVLDTTISMVFTIYADSGGTVSKWTETQGAVKVEKGIFNILLGSVNVIPDTVFDGNIRYLGVTLGADPEITPRKPMVSVPYAYKTMSGGGDIGWADDGNVVRLTTSTDSVGIGTTTPTEKLDVVGTAKMTGFKMTTSPSNGYVLTSDASGVGTWQAAGGTIGGSGTANYIPKFTAATTIGNSVIYETGGEIGIGTTSPNEQVEITGNLRLPATTSTTGMIKIGIDRFIHAYGSSNTFVGQLAGNLTMTGGANTANGYQALYSNTIGGNNTANGYQALYSNTTGYYNTATGYQALYSDTTGYNNTAIGFQALYSSTMGINNTANGYRALRSNTTGYRNSAIGVDALYSNTTGYNNTAIGINALHSNTTGYRNTALGNSADVSSGNLTNATAIGANAVVAVSNALVLGGTGLNAVNVGIGTTSPEGALDVVSTTGALIVPRMTTAQRDALTAVNGMIIYNTTDNQFNFYENGAWVTK